MGTLYVDRKGCELQLRDGALELRADGTLVRTLPAALIERVVLRADTRLGSATLAALGDCGIGVLAFGGRAGQRVAHLLGRPHGSARARVAQCQRLDDEVFAAAWSRAIVRRKLLNQRRLLNTALAERPDLRKPLGDACEGVGRCLERLGAARTRETVRGLEGSAAASYFRGYAALFAPALGFERRRRRPPPDPVNACLSLGYTLLQALGTEAAWTAGLDPMIGLLHLPAPGRASFACDLVEPWRAAVDRWVWQQFRSRDLRPEHFGRDGAGACVIGKAARSHLYAAIQPLLRHCGRGMRRQALVAARMFADAARWPDATDATDATDGNDDADAAERPGAEEGTP
jgi:CRISPR-associated protein Cas1